MSDISSMVNEFAAALTKAQTEAITTFVAALQQNASDARITASMLEDLLAEHNDYLDKILRAVTAKMSEPKDDGEKMAAIIDAIRSIPPPQVTVTPQINIPAPVVNVSTPAAQVTVMPAPAGKGLELRITSRDGNGAIARAQLVPL